MSIPQSCRIHPTAILSPEVKLGEDVVIGPYSILEGDITVGPGCLIKSHVYICGKVTLGKNNQVFSGAVLGEQPQHLKYNGEPTAVVIGDNNTFRENVTIHRGTPASGTTRIGNNNFLMASCHVAHDCVVGNQCILANNALMAGHCQLADGAFISGNSGLHQHVRMGRLAMLSGCSGASQDIPPYMIVYERNITVGVNIVGMRRAGIEAKQIAAVRRAYYILYRHNLTLPESLTQVEAEVGEYSTVQEVLEFIKTAPRGVSLVRTRKHAEAA